MALPVPLVFTVKAPPADPTSKAAVSAEAAGNALRAHFKGCDGAAVATVADLLGGCVAALAPLGIVPAPHRDDGSGTETASRPTHEFRVFVAAAPPLQLHHRGRPQQDRTLLSDLLWQIQTPQHRSQGSSGSTASTTNTSAIAAVLAVHIGISALSTNKSAGGGDKKHGHVPAAVAVTRCPYVPEKEDALLAKQQQQRAAVLGEDETDDNGWDTQCSAQAQWDIQWGGGIHDSQQTPFQTTGSGNRWAHESGEDSDSFSMFD